VIVFGREAYAKVDLRVDEHPDPVVGLRRVWGIFKLHTRPFLGGMAKSPHYTHAEADFVSFLDHLFASAPTARWRVV
jgi:hypothetical protein